MKNSLFLLLIFFSAVFQCNAQKSSFLVLGDIHYDLLEDHDMDWLSKKPDDLRQVTKEYVIYTDQNWKAFTTVLQQKVRSESPSMKAIIQLGDLSEGLAGSLQKARQMAGNVMNAISKSNMPVPWILTKGNHDVTGPGAVEAFQEFYVPMIRKQTNQPDVKNSSYSYCTGDVQITCLDPWDKSVDMVSFLDKELSSSKAKFKFIAIHEPVIPVTERCWHTLRRDPIQRGKLLEVIARNKAIVLCGHLHRYSVVCRNTALGPIVQVMAISVIKDRNYQKPSYLITKYGASLAENVPGWEPETLEARKSILAEEAKFVTYYKQTDLPGYALIKVDSDKSTIQLEYYAAFGKEPYDKVDLAKLLNP